MNLLWMEVVKFRDKENVEAYDKSWATCGHENKRKHNTITSIHIAPAVLEQWNIGLQEKYRLITSS